MLFRSVVNNLFAGAGISGSSGISVSVNRIGEAVRSINDNYSGCPVAVLPIHIHGGGNDVGKGQHGVLERRCLWTKCRECEVVDGHPLVVTGIVYVRPADDQPN